MSQLIAGDVAPDFKALSTSGQEVTLSDFKGKTIVLYFYPKDDTPGCTIEAKEFTEEAARFSRSGAVVLGVSIDDVDCHKAFIDKFGLKIDLLADPHQEIAKAYGSHGEGYAQRNTFVIDGEGKIKKVFLKVKPQGHADEVLKSLTL